MCDQSVTVVVRVEDSELYFISLSHFHFNFILDIGLGLVDVTCDSYLCHKA